MLESRFAGVAWASEEHAVCVVDDTGRIVEGRRCRHSEVGLRALCSRLQRLAVKLVAIERPDGLLIERLLDAGLVVIAVHPNQVRAAGPRYTVVGARVISSTASCWRSSPGPIATASGSWCQIAIRRKRSGC
jgi:hypothetical protein